MSNLSSFHKQIISKYFDNFNDYNNLFKVSSFNYITIPFYRKKKLLI